MRTRPGYLSLTAAEARAAGLVPPALPTVRVPPPVVAKAAVERVAMLASDSPLPPGRYVVRAEIKVQEPARQRCRPAPLPQCQSPRPWQGQRRSRRAAALVERWPIARRPTPGFAARRASRLKCLCFRGMSR